MLLRNSISLLSFLLWLNTYNIKFAILAIIKCTVQCYELCLHYCATTTNHLFPKLFITPSRKLIPPLHPKLVSRHSSASSTMSHLKMLHKGLKMFPYFCGIYHCGRLRCVRLTLWKLLLPLGQPACPRMSNQAGFVSLCLCLPQSTENSHSVCLMTISLVHILLYCSSSIKIVLGL